MLLRTLVDRCLLVLGPHQFVITDRGRLKTREVVELGRDGAEDRAMAVLGHDAGERLLLARLSGPRGRFTLTFERGYRGPDDGTSLSGAIVQHVERWMYAAPQRGLALVVPPANGSLDDGRTPRLEGPGSSVTKLSTSRAHLPHRVCAECGGTAQCADCSGTGQHRLLQVACYLCLASGACWYCAGRGLVPDHRRRSPTAWPAASALGPSLSP